MPEDSKYTFEPISSLFFFFAKSLFSAVNFTQKVTDFNRDFPKLNLSQIELIELI